MKYILGTLLAIFCATASYDAFAGPNITHILTQVGDNLELTILQEGKGQHIDLDLGLQYGNVDNLTMWIGQLGEDNDVEFLPIR